MGRGGIESAQEVGAATVLAMQVAPTHIAHGLVLRIGDHHVAPIMLVHQFQRIVDRRLRAD
ncbi:hypothetical protein D3C76_1405830 [compost metagenome]